MTLNQIHALVQSHNRQHTNSNHLCSVRSVSRSASAFVWRLISSLYKFGFFYTCKPESDSSVIWQPRETFRPPDLQKSAERRCSTTDLTVAAVPILSDQEWTRHASQQDHSTSQPTTHTHSCI